MADRTSASIEIGGILDARLVPDFVAAARLDHGCVGWDEPALEEDMVRSGETLEVFAMGLAGGRFEHLEAFCMAYGLQFKLRAASCQGVFGAERVLYDGEGPVRVFEESENGYVVLSLHAIRTLGTMDAIERWFAAAEAEIPSLTLVKPPAAAGLDF